MAIGCTKGRKVRVMYTVPINFALNDDDKKTDNKPEEADKTSKEQPDTIKNKTFTAVEVQPVFPGGQGAFMQFLKNTVRYPKAAYDAKVTGKAYVSFVVDKDGSLTNIKVVRDPGSGLGDEALRVINFHQNGHQAHRMESRLGFSIQSR